MAPKKKELKQGDFFGNLGVAAAVDDTVGKKATGGHVSKHKEAERTAHDIQNPATTPIPRRIVTENASNWANEH